MKNDLKSTGATLKKIIKTDTENVKKFSSTLYSSIYTPEDKTGSNTSIVTTPPFNPVTLKRLCQVNNRLLQCVQTMEVNIDGTGHTFVPIDSETEISEEDFQTLTDFFNEPYPNEGFIEQRRKLRNDLESTGNGYLSVIENGKGEMVACQVLPSARIKVGKSSQTISRDFIVKRKGVDFTLSLPTREDVYSYQDENGNLTYFLGYGTEQFIHKKTGVISSNLDIVNRGGKIIHFRIVDDPTSYYGIPRWINQLPSVTGSRKAEEQNLELLDNGGIPSAIIFLKGGTAVDDAERTLAGFLNGGFETNRAVAVTIQSTEGTIDSTGKVDVQVERFGSESVRDSMYQNYQQDCRTNIRQAFRLPPLFTGETSDYTYATAYISYMIAEAQIFKPERDAFDEVINNSIVKALGVTTAKFQSNPISLSDATEQLKAVMSVKDIAEPQDIIDTVNQLADLNLRFKEGATFTTSTNELGTIGDNIPESVLKSDTQNILEFALDMGRVKGLISGEPTHDKAEIVKKFDKMTAKQQAFINQVISIAVFQTTEIDCCH